MSALVVRSATWIGSFSIALLALPARATASDGHLYIAGNSCSVWCGRAAPSGVLRYPLHGGVPAVQPDMRYPQVTGPLALDATNHLYTFSLDGTHIDVFRPGSSSVERTIDLQSGTPPPYAGLAVDESGAAYVAPLLDGDDAYYVPASPCGWLVAIYAPGASGDATPARCLPQTSAYSFSLPADGELIEAASPIGADALFAFGTPKVAPYLARTLYGPSVARPVATAASDGELYVLNAPHGSSSYVAVYDAAASGSVTPIRMITPQAGHNGTWSGAIAVDAAYLYVTTGTPGFPQLLVYDRTATGPAAPLASLRIAGASVTAVAVGP